MIDVDAIRSALINNPPRDVIAEGDGGVVIVWETGPADAIRAADAIYLAMLQVDGVFSHRKVKYFSAAYNANAYSLHMHFAPKDSNAAEAT